MGLLVFCGSVVRSGIALARVPKWRFRKVPNQKKRTIFKDLARALSWYRIKTEVLGSGSEIPPLDSASSSGEETDVNGFRPPKRVQTLGPRANPSWDGGKISRIATDMKDFEPSSLSRRHTLSYADEPSFRDSMRTPSGRRKRATSQSIRPFLKLTHTQATIKKWMYAVFVYVVMLAVILAGIRPHIQYFALHGNEPFGWALGYLFGDLPSFRLQVLKLNLESWITLPPRFFGETAKQCHMGWVQQLRHDDIGEANTRLLISGYWVCVFTIGLVTVFKLKEIYEVDTRRKVFHFMMVGMLLPATFVDPTFAALALAIMLGIFLALDLLRASQLPPLSKPIASFLAPYVDGRDFRGPVVISHIFLLIGCAIPLWLALAALPRMGSDNLTGWEVPTRDVSMVSGVICVGLGDAAASLIGRRYGHRKWLWGGGKSIEGSVAFAAAVFLGLAAASVWLQIGRWPIAGGSASVLVRSRNAGICASMASLTEAVLTGGNDNVIVPVVLWTCVKSLPI
jgi:dolichol kinase